MTSIPINEESIKEMEQYSDNPALLRKALDGLKVSYSGPEYKLHFADDTQRRNVYNITLSRNGNKISFKYGDSIANAQAGKKDIDMYSILSTVGAEYYIPDNFKDFVSEFGYNEDSSKAKEQFKRSLAHSKKLHKIFNEEEASALPR